MENASKALIIAGAILVSILIIGLGMYLYTTASGVFDSNQLKEQQARTYNDQFEKYFGSKVTGSNVRALYDAVRNHNITNQSDTSLTITIKHGTSSASTAAQLNTDKAAIQAGKVYTVEGTAYDLTSGYITEITVTD